MKESRYHVILSAPKFCVTSPQSPRWEAFQSRFQGLKVTPIYHNGRSLSETNTQIIQDNINFPAVMIFEDDACPVTPDYIYQIQEIEKQLEGLNWDVLYLGAHLLAGAGRYLTANLFHDIGPYCTHAVLYKSSAYIELLNLTRRFPNIHPHAWDDMIYSTKLVKIAAVPMIVTQLEPNETTGMVDAIMRRSYSTVMDKNRK